MSTRISLAFGGAGGCAMHVFLDAHDGLSADKPDPHVEIEREDGSLLVNARIGRACWDDFLRDVVENKGRGR